MALTIVENLLDQDQVKALVADQRYPSIIPMRSPVDTALVAVPPEGTKAGSAYSRLPGGALKFESADGTPLGDAELVPVTQAQANEIRGLIAIAEAALLK